MLRDHPHLLFERELLNVRFLRHNRQICSKVSKTVKHIEIVIFPMEGIGQPNQCCFVIVASLEAMEHVPHKLYCKKIFSEFIRTECNAANRENQLSKRLVNMA